MVKKTSKIFLTVLFLLLPIITLQVASVTPPVRLTTTATTERLHLKLYNATYGDFDDDGKNDDIICHLDITVNSELHRKTLLAEITLTLPNGDSYSYSILVSIVSNTITLTIYFMNHAYVPGDYHIKAEVNLYTEGVYYSSAELYFDPPSEEVPDDDPYITYFAS